MFKNPVELAELLATTKDLIASNTWSLAFTRQTYTRVPGGGQTKDAPDTLDPQDVYLGAVMIDASYTVYWQGNKVQADYVIVGLPDLDIEENDEFEAESRKFIVVEIHPDHQYETRAWCIDRTSSGRG